MRALAHKVSCYREQVEASTQARRWVRSPPRAAPLVTKSGEQERKQRLHKQEATRLAQQEGPRWGPLPWLLCTKHQNRDRVGAPGRTAHCTQSWLGGAGSPGAVLRKSQVHGISVGGSLSGFAERLEEVGS